ncbi:MAG: Ltp family lipoprotein [Corynebacterium sp.]|nr:Ltp family lipoprotein [Corynebacterium sp.]
MANSEHDHDAEDLDKALEDAVSDSPENPDAEEAGRHAKHAAADESATEVVDAAEVDEVEAEPATEIFETADAENDAVDAEPSTEIFETEEAVDASPETEILPTADEVEAADSWNTVGAAADPEAADPETEILEEPQTQGSEAVAAPAKSRKKAPLIIGGAVVVIAIVGVLLWALTNGNENTEGTEEASTESTTSAAPAPISSEGTPAPAPAPAEETSPVELADAFPEASAPPPEAGSADGNAEAQDALAAAQSYVNVLSLSEPGLRESLLNTQPNGREGFSPEAVDYAMANVNVDYNAEAAEVASQYANLQMPADRIREQLLLDGFTEEQAQFGISSLG